MPVPKIKKEKVGVHAGQVYRSKAHKGFRFVRIMQVRGLGDHNPYVIYREILPSGKFASGHDKNGLRRGEPLAKPMSWNGTDWYLPFLELVPDWKPREKTAPSEEEGGDEGEACSTEEPSS